MATPNKSGYVVNTTKGLYYFKTLEDLNAWRASRGLPPERDEEISLYYRVTGDLGTVITNSLEEAQAMADNTDLYNLAVIEQSLPIQKVGYEFPVLKPVKPQRRWASESLPVYLGQQPGIDVLQGKNYSPEYNRVFYGAPMGSELFGDLRQEGVERAWETNPEYMHEMNEAGDIAGYTAASIPLIVIGGPAALARTNALTIPELIGATTTSGVLLNEAGNSLDLWNTPSFYDWFARRKHNKKRANVGTQTGTQTGTLPGANTGTDAEKNAETPTEESTTASETPVASESSTPTPESNNDNNTNDKRSLWKKIKDARDAYKGKGNLNQPTPQEPKNNWRRFIHATKNNSPTWKPWVRFSYNAMFSPYARLGMYVGSSAIDEAFGTNTNDFVLNSYPYKLALANIQKEISPNKEKQDNSEGNNDKDTSASDTISVIYPETLLLDSINTLKTDSIGQILDEYYNNSNFE